MSDTPTQIQIDALTGANGPVEVQVAEGIGRTALFRGLGFRERLDNMGDTAKTDTSKPLGGVTTPDPNIFDAHRLNGIAVDARDNNAFEIRHQP